MILADLRAGHLDDGGRRVLAGGSGECGRGAHAERPVEAVL
jgi:hypothetical protein